MTPTDIRILPFDGKHATPAEYAALNRHSNLIRLERQPDDPPIPLDENIQNIQSIPPFVEVKFWAAWNADQSEIVAFGDVVFYRTEENQHMAPIDISVLPAYRRQGLGRELLALIAAAAEQDKRRLLLTDTNDRVPAGEAFMQRIGAQKGLETHVNQLRIADLDRSWLAGWLARGQGLQAEFELGFWDGAYPEEMLQEVADLYEVTNQQPHGDIEIEDMHMTPEQLRQMENNIFARGSQRWTYYLIDRAAGKFAGYTETFWNPNRPEILGQGMTGVFPQYRKRGLGRWLKAVMLDKVLRDLPQVKVVRTGNADSNAAMLKINTELGFAPYMASAIWQVELEKVQEYLRA